MKTKCGIGMLIGHVVWASSSAWAGAVERPSFAEVLNLYKQYLDSIKTLQLSYTNIEVSPPPFGTRRSIRTWSYKADRCLERYDIWQYADAAFKIPTEKAIQSWDGSQFYVWRRYTENRARMGLTPDGEPEHPGSGSIQNAPLFIVGPHFTDYFATFNTGRIQMVEWLQTGGPRNLGPYHVAAISQTVNQRPCIRLELEHSTIWMEQERGMIIRFETYGRPDINIDILESAQFKGVWIPIKARYVCRYASWTVNVAVDPTSVKVNEPLDDGLFGIKFPIGAAVNDTVNKRIYMVESPDGNPDPGYRGPAPSPEQRLESILDKNKKKSVQQGFH